VRARIRSGACAAVGRAGQAGLRIEQLGPNPSGPIGRSNHREAGVASCVFLRVLPAVFRMKELGFVPNPTGEIPNLCHCSVQVPQHLVVGCRGLRPPPYEQRVFPMQPVMCYVYAAARSNPGPNRERLRRKEGAGPATWAPPPMCPYHRAVQFGRDPAPFAVRACASGVPDTRWSGLALVNLATTPRSRDNQGRPWRPTEEAVVDLVVIRELRPLRPPWPALQEHRSPADRCTASVRC
jgi:hypothetical protein